MHFAIGAAVVAVGVILVSKLIDEKKKPTKTIYLNSNSCLGNNSSSQRQIQKQRAQFGKQLEKINVELQKAQKQIQTFKKSGNPENYVQNRQKIFVSFLNNLKQFKYTGKIGKQPNTQYYIVMGLSSAGKSSLLMKITGQNLKTGHGITTKFPYLVEEFYNKTQSVRLYDAPGISQSFLSYSIPTLALLYTQWFKQLQFIKTIQIIQGNYLEQLIQSNLIGH